MNAEMPFLPAALSVTANTIGDVRVLAGGDELLHAVQHEARRRAARRGW